MTSIRICALAAFGAVVACAPARPEQQLVADAARALGGRDKIIAAKTMTIEGEGTNANLGQDMTMDASGQHFAVSTYRRVIDLQNLRSHTEQTRTPDFAFFQGPQPQKQVFGVADGIAYAIAADGTATRASNAVARDRTAEIYHHPLTIVSAAMDPGTKFSNVRTAGGERVVDLETATGLKFTLAIDAASGLPTRVVSMTDNTNLGDVAIETSFADYQDVSGLKAPARFTVKTDKYITATLHVTRQAIDESASGPAAPAAASAAPAVAGPAPATVAVTAIASGVWYLAGQSHHSVVVEFADHLMLIEAPQNDTRTLAVIARARELRTGKPLTQVVNTHHHFDHSGGIRAAVSEGLTVITDKANVAYLQDAAVRSHTIVPDALAKNPKPATVLGVDGQMEIKDDTMTVDLFHIEGSPHGDAMLMAYLPRQRILVEADAFSAGSAVQPYAANLVENITRRNLKVDRILALHGPLTTYAELVHAVPRP
jgi:glyoxylase-like metal-dependent hydrolase (beta-lactamase superfamily II)